MDEKQRRLKTLSKYVIDGQLINRLEESEDWRVLVEELMSQIETGLRELLSPETTSQRYYELRAEINSVKKLFDKIDTIQARSKVAGQQKAQIENS